MGKISTGLKIFHEGNKGRCEKCENCKFWWRSVMSVFLPRRGFNRHYYLKKVNEKKPCKNPIK